MDLKRQLQVIDQEASVLRNKVQSLETENEKLIAENKKLSLLRGTKSKSSEKNLDKYIDQIAKLEIELGEAQEKIKALESSPNSVNSKPGEIQSATLKKFTQRTPKKVTALTSRDQLKTMVSDLEKEIGEMLVSWKLSESTKLKLEEEKGNGKSKLEYDKMLKDIEEMKKKYEAVQKELTEERAKVLNENKKYEDLNKTLNHTKESLEKSVEEKNKLKEQIEKSSKEQHKLLEDKKKLDDEISKLRTNLSKFLLLL